MAKSWVKIWNQGVDRAHQGTLRDGGDYRVVPTVDRPLGVVSLSDPSWVKAVDAALAAPVPSRAFEFWRQEGWLRHGLPEIDTLWGIPQPPLYHPEVDTGVHAMMVIDQAAAHGYSQRARWAALAHDFGKSITPRDKWPAHHGHEEAGVPLVQDRFKSWGLPANVINLAVAVTRHHGVIHRIASLRAATILDVIEDARLENDPAMLVDFSHGVEADDRGRLGFFNTAGRSTELLHAIVTGLARDHGRLAVDQEATWEKRLKQRTLIEATGKRLVPLTDADRARFDLDYLRMHRIASVKRSTAAWRASVGLQPVTEDEVVSEPSRSPQPK